MILLLCLMVDSCGGVGLTVGGIFTGKEVDCGVFTGLCCSVESVLSTNGRVKGNLQVDA